MPEALEVALGKLGDADRELLLLVAVDGLELRQAAEVLGISYEALRQRLTRSAAADRAHCRSQRSARRVQVPQ
ncbi:MAG: sigma factor-like helix-turn-helix DNA-binding protein [Polyangiaceae bacterium]